MVWGLEKGLRDGITMSREIEKCGIQKSHKNDKLDFVTLKTDWSKKMYVKVMSQPKIYSLILVKI